MELEKTVDGEGKVSIWVDGDVAGYDLSRKLTGTTDESGEGIFNTERTCLHFGDFESFFSFPRPLWPTLPVAKTAEILEERIQQVRKWVEECQETAGKVEIHLPKIED